MNDIKEPIIDNIKYNVEKFLGKMIKCLKCFHGKSTAWLNLIARIEHMIDDKELMVTEGKCVVIHG